MNNNNLRALMIYALSSRGVMRLGAGAYYDVAIRDYLHKLNGLAGVW